MNDILFSPSSKQQHGKNYDITKHDRANKFSLPYIILSISFTTEFSSTKFFSVAFKKKSLFLFHYFV